MRLRRLHIFALILLASCAYLPPVMQGHWQSWYGPAPDHVAPNLAGQQVT